MVMLVMTSLGALLLIYLMYQPAPAVEVGDPEPDPPEPPRNFTKEQLLVSVKIRFPSRRRFTCDAMVEASKSLMSDAR